MADSRLIVGGSWPTLRNAGDPYLSDIALWKAMGSGGAVRWSV